MAPYPPEVYFGTALSKHLNSPPDIKIWPGLLVLGGSVERPGTYYVRIRGGPGAEPALPTASSVEQTPFLLAGERCLGYGIVGVGGREHAPRRRVRCSFNGLAPIERRPEEQGTQDAHKEANEGMRLFAAWQLNPPPI
jgi:hypothetical protein